MRKLILAGALAFAIAPASASAAGTPSAEGLAKASCKAQKAEMGAKLFKRTYNAKSVAKAVKSCAGVTEDTAADALENAAKDCKAERDADAETFAMDYGTNANGKNAYGKCVSSKAKDQVQEETDATVTAAETCKALKKDEAATFESTYGTKKNAFGKCVSATAKAQDDESST
jgi:hypothetical protein